MRVMGESHDHSGRYASTKEAEGRIFRNNNTVRLDDMSYPYNGRYRSRDYRQTKARRPGDTTVRGSWGGHMTTAAVTPLQKRQKEGLSGTIIPLRLDAAVPRVSYLSNIPAVSRIITCG